MNTVTLAGPLIFALHILVQVGLIARVLLRAHRQPASRIAWVVVIMALPIVGILAYLLLGETSVGRQRVQRMRGVLAHLPDPCNPTAMHATATAADLPQRHAHLFEVGKTINGFSAVGGNRAQLTPDSNAAIDAMVTDIDAAQDHVHLVFYIWLADNNGCKVVDALERAAKRGVTCRAMADALGSRAMIESAHWQRMHEAGVKLARALPFDNPLLRPFHGRIDLRNHRKILVVDNIITYCGSQNCADPEFVVKARFAPWVDIMMRFEGPIARQNQHLFASDWEVETGEDISELLTRPLPAPVDGFAAQVVGTGPTVRYSAMPEMFETLMYAARRELVITTPYFVPDESMQGALCASARRGVDTRIVFPLKNDSWIVGAASRSYYAELLEAGVRIFEYEGGLLHAKTLTIDAEITLLGSANMDRRSFELNYENNILLFDPALTRAMRERQDSYLAQSQQVTLDMTAEWPWRRRLANNAIAMFGPVL